MPGAMSDADRNYLQSMVPNLAMTGPGRKELIKTQEALAKRSQQVAKMMREYVQDPAHEALDSHFFDQLQAFSDANPMFTNAPPPTPAVAPQGAASATTVNKLRGRVIVPNADSTGWVFDDTGEEAK